MGLAISLAFAAVQCYEYRINRKAVLLIFINEIFQSETG